MSVESTEVVTEEEKKAEAFHSRKKKIGFWEKYIYNPPVYAILAVEFVERFGYYALTAILIIFFTSQLGLSTTNAVIVYHAIKMFGYFTPILGAIVSDNYIGRYKTILYFAIIYCVGAILLAVTSIPMILEKVTMAGPLISLLLIMTGMGGIKPCVSTFGADQFRDHEQSKIETYFSIFYMSINIGSILSYLISPLLRSKVQCFGGDCYFLAFGFPALLMLVVITIFLSSTKLYTHKQTEANAIGKISKVTYVAIRERLKNIKKKSEGSLLDWAKDYVDDVSINDAKILFRVILIFVPIPMFWALFNQQGSLWTLQAIRMSGNMGAAGYMIPDQMQVVNPMLIVILLPLIDAIISGLEKLKIKVKPLRKIFAGMVISGFAFIISGGLEIMIDKELGKGVSLESGKTGLQFYNNIPSSLRISLTHLNETTYLLLSQNQVSDILKLPVATEMILSVEDHIDSSKKFINYTIPEDLLQDNHLYSAVLYTNSGHNMLSINEFELESDSSVAKIRFIFVPGVGYQGHDVFTLTIPQSNTTVSFGTPTQFFGVPFGSYDARINETSSIPLRYTPGGVYTLTVTFNSLNDIEIQAHENRSPSRYHMLLQIPQYFIITIGEVLINVTGLSFAYDQAPKRIKVAITSAWLLTTAFGNLIVIIVEAIAGEAKGSTLFFVFAGLMFIVSFLFAIIAYYYKPTNKLIPEFSLKESKSTEELP